MTHALRNGALFGALTAAAVATWYLGQREPPVVASSEPTAPRGLYFRDAAILGTDSAGHVSYRIFAKSVEQPEQDHALVLSEVRVEYDAREEIPWLVTAARATRLGNGETMKLYEARLSSLPEPGAAALVIETEELELEPESYVARSERPVVLSQGSARLEAQRLSADLKQHRIVLESGHGQLNR
jgi:LPS export ABC transporter protein LptC